MEELKIPIFKKIIDWVFKNNYICSYEQEETELLIQLKQGKIDTYEEVKFLSEKTNLPFGYFFLNEPPKEEILEKIKSGRIHIYKDKEGKDNEYNQYGSYKRKKRRII